MCPGRGVRMFKGTSNNDDFVVGSTAVAARRSFSLLIWRGYVSAFCGSAPFRALQANRAIMRQPSAPASQAGGYCRRAVEALTVLLGPAGILVFLPVFRR